MPDAHEPVLIALIAIGLALAFALGLLARRLRLPPILGYLLAGIAIGPFTPGFVADPDLALQLAEIGVILLMFGVGIHFSLRDILAVRKVAIPGAAVQISVATLLGTLLGLALGWPLSEAAVLGLSISVASTVVLIRALMERGELLSAQGRIAVGWLIVEDIFTVVVLVLLPSLATANSAAGSDAGDVTTVVVDVALAVAKAGLFAVLVIGVGIRVVPRLLAFVARLQDRELFTLAAVAIAIGIAYLSFALFGISLALGAFLAGAIVSESDTSHQVAADAQPLRDIFSVLFFVSVGMLLDPSYLAANLPAVATVVFVVIVAKAAAAFAIVAALGEQPRVGLTVAAGLAQVGEFTFILATTALSLGMMRPEGVQLVVSAAIVSITLNPILFAAIDPVARAIARRPRLAARVSPRPGALSTLPDTAPAGPRAHAVIIGSGRVGRLVIGALERRGFPFVVVSEDRHDVERLRDNDRLAVFGDAAHVEVLDAAHVKDARVLVLAISDEHSSRLIVARARAANPRLALVVRTHSSTYLEDLIRLEGSVQAIHGEVELSAQMTRHTLRRFGVSAVEADAVAGGLRGRAGRPWSLEPE